MDYVFWTLALLVTIVMAILSPQFEEYRNAKAERMKKLGASMDADHEKLKAMIEDMEAVKARALAARAEAMRQAKDDIEALFKRVRSRHPTLSEEELLEILEQVEQGEIDAKYAFNELCEFTNISTTQNRGE